MLKRGAESYGLGLVISQDGKRFSHSGRNAGFDSLLIGSANLGGVLMINRNVNSGAVGRMLQKAIEFVARPD
jgi:hypothetical protein